MSDRPNRRFPTTRWSLISSVRAQDDGFREALAGLCRDYWLPVYAYARHRGYAVDQAEDLTQGFFAKLLEKDYVAQADRERGRFRTFLLAAFNHYLANEWHHAHAEKRGGHQTMLSLDFATAEGQLAIEPVDSTTPETLFARQWGRALLDKALQRLSDAQTGPNRERFARLRHCLTDSDPVAPYRQLAEELGLSESAVKTAVHRLRRDFSRVLRETVAETVENEDAVADEIRFLLESQR